MARVVCPRVALVLVWQEDGLRHRPFIGSRARTLQPDLGAPCRRTDADLRGLHLFEASRSSASACQGLYQPPLAQRT